jgi:Fe-S-cluster containining protein
MGQKKRRTQTYQQLDLLRERIPTIQCKRLCQYACRSVPIAFVEYQRLKERVGLARLLQLNDTDQHRCPLLTEDGKCSVYDIRPFICHIWGTVDMPSMVCPFGCEPENGRLSPVEFETLWREVESISHNHTNGEDIFFSLGLYQDDFINTCISKGGQLMGEGAQSRFITMGKRIPDSEPKKS